MTVLFYVPPIMVIALVLFLASKAIRRSLDLRSAWSSGLTAEARCLRSYTTVGGGGHDTAVTTTLHHVYEFTTREGRAVRFEESGGRPTVVEGDIVTVHYAAERPDKATAHAPSPGRAAVGTVTLVACCGMVVALCIGFMIAFHEMFASGDALFGGV
jgi:hypothetical protein